MLSCLFLFNQHKAVLKIYLRRIHLAIAWVTCLFLFILSLTGAILIYAKDIQRLVHPHIWTVEPTDRPLNIAHIAHIVQKVQKKAGFDINFITVEQQPDLAWQAQLNNGDYVSINPYTAEVLQRYDYYQTLYGFTMALHRWLVLKNEDGTTPLRNWVSSVALLLILEVLIGFILWIRPKKRLKRLKVKFTAKRKVFYNQVHTVLGVYFFLPLMLIAFSGIAFNWSQQTAWLVEKALNQPIEYRKPAPLVLSKAAGYDVENSIKQGMSALPEAQLYRVYFPNETSQPLMLRMQMPGETHAYSYVWMDPYTAQVLQVQDGSKAGFSTQVWNFRYKFHIGDFAGPIVQFLWFVICFFPVLFAATGVYMWVTRK